MSADAPESPTASCPVLAHPAVLRVHERLVAAGVPGRIVVLDGAARTAAQAAAFLGVEVAQIANSLVFTVPVEGTDPADGIREPLLILTSGAHRVDTAKVAALLNVTDLGRADADFVRERTGFVIGGVAPVGHLHPVRTLVDRALADHEVVWAAAGHPHSVFPTTYAELVRITHGTPADVA